MAHQTSIVDISEVNLAIKNGGEQFWRVVYGKYASFVKKTLAYHNPDLPVDIIENLAHNVLLKLTEKKSHAPQFEVEKQLIKWLYRTMETTVIDFHRLKTNSVFNSTDRVDNIDELPGDMEIDIDDSLEAEKPTIENIEKGMAMLPERDRKLLRMGAEGTPFKVIAQELGMKENATRVYFGRAKAKFAKLYEKLFGRATK
jgi:RNA polymerase sigma factor (sigma-70 family)